MRNRPQAFHPATAAGYFSTTPCPLISSVVQAGLVQTLRGALQSRDGGVEGRSEVILTLKKEAHEPVFWTA